MWFSAKLLTKDAGRPGSSRASLHAEGRNAEEGDEDGKGDGKVRNVEMPALANTPWLAIIRSVKTPYLLATMFSLSLLAGFASSACQSDAHARRNEFYQQCLQQKGPTPTPEDQKDCKAKTKEFAREQKGK